MKNSLQLDWYLVLVREIIRWAFDIILDHDDSEFRELTYDALLERRRKDKKRLIYSVPNIKTALPLKKGRAVSFSVIYLSPLAKEPFIAEL